MSVRVEELGRQDHKNPGKCLALSFGIKSNTTNRVNSIQLKQ